MSDRNSRTKKILSMPSLARMDHRNFLTKEGRLVWENTISRNERRRIKFESKKIANQYKKILKNLFHSGVGFSVDRTLRQMAIEYTSRFASSGTETLPTSFNYFEPFCYVRLMQKCVAPYIDLVPEVNHLFNVSDFFDFLTSAEGEDFSVEELLRIPEARTLHFSNSGDIAEITFFDAFGREYVLSGFSMVRRGNSLHWFLVAGEKLSQDQWSLREKDVQEFEIEGVPLSKRAFIKEVMEKRGKISGPPMKLEGTESAVRTLVAGEFDILKKKHIGKSIFIESENSYAVCSNDPEIISEIPSANKRKEVIENALNRLNEADVLWNVAEGFFQLPRYFETRITVSRNLIKDRKGKVGLKGKGGRGVNADYVAVEAVALEDSESPPVIRRVTMPMYSNEVNGHWRRLKIGQTGKDRDGNSVSGKTWVNKSSLWRDRRRSDGVVYVKDSLAAAKTQVETLYAASADVEVEKRFDASVSGQLYVLRCPLMKDEIYKVGWTSGTAVERARQLSTATGVPMAFVVVECWDHDDPEALETEVHAQLSSYRVNFQREFFQLDLKLIRKIIVRTIERVK